MFHATSMFDVYATAAIILLGRAIFIFARISLRVNVVPKVPARERIYSSNAVEIIFMLTKLNWNTVQRVLDENNGPALERGYVGMCGEEGGLKERKDEQIFRVNVGQ